MNRPVSGACAAVLVLALLSSPAVAGAIDSLGQSPAPPQVGYYPLAPSLLADGHGGVIVVWEADFGADSFEKRDIYAQHVLARGVVDPLWPPGGLEIGFAPDVVRSHVLVGDAAGGAIVAWPDCRKGKELDVYAQHVLANGTCDPAWPARGRALCTAVGDQDNVDIVSDGAGGAIVAWSDGRRDRRGHNWDIYAQHVSSRGELDPRWPAEGRLVCTARRGRYPAGLVADGVGGAIVVWVDGRRKHDDIFAQHLLASGAPDPAWPAQGRALCTARGDQWANSTLCVPDGAGGALAGWQDFRLGKPIDRGAIYAQHVTAGGALDPAWPADGGAVYRDQVVQWTPTGADDGSGGVFVACEDYRHWNRNIYVQHVLASGPDSTWPAEGLAFCRAKSWQSSPAIVADGAGGVIAVWMDDRNSHDYDGNTDIYAQHVSRGGRVDPAWPAEGLAVCTAPKMQEHPVIAADGSGGAIVAWFDFRPGALGLYAQHLLAEGRSDPQWPVGGLGLVIWRPGGQ